MPKIQIILSHFKSINCFKFPFQLFQSKLKEQQAQSENEIIQLYKKMADENMDRIREIEDLNERLKAEKGEIRDRLEKEKEELRIQLEKENSDLRSQLDDSKRGLQGDIDNNHFTTTGTFI